MSNTSATRVQQKRHEWDTSEKFWFLYRDESENMYSHPYISYIANERLQGEEPFHSKKYLLDVHRSQAKMLYQKVVHQIVAANTLARSRIVTDSNTVLFSIKNT